MTDTSFAQHNPLARLTKAALAIGGVLGAAYIVVSRGELIGAEAMLTGRWMVAHNLHFASAAFLLFGVVGLYLSHSRFMKLGGHFAFVLALLGTAFFFATGVMSSALLPAIAAYSPRAVAAAGPLYNPTLPALIVSVGVFQIGWVGLGIVIARAGLLPKWTGWLTAAGAAIGLVPAHPFGPAPWLITEIGWVMFAIGLVGMGIAGWKRDLR